MPPRRNGAADAIASAVAGALAAATTDFIAAHITLFFAGGPIQITVAAECAQGNQNNRPPTPLERQILGVLGREPLTPKQIAGRMGRGRPTGRLYATLARMRTTGAIVEVPGAGYRLP